METLSHISRLIKAFCAFDSDNDGLINEAELGGIMGSLGYKASKQEIETMMQKGSDNGLLTISKFLDIMNTGDHELDGLTTLKTALEALDLKDDDLVTGDELYGAVEDMGMELCLDDCRDIVTSMDGDGDGAITFEDFKLIVNSLL